MILATETNTNLARYATLIRDSDGQSLNYFRLDIDCENTVRTFSRPPSVQEQVMDISDFKISCEELEQLMPVLEKCDPVWSQFLQRQIALGRHYPREAGCVREADDRTQMDMFFLLGTTITKPDKIEGLSNLEFLADCHAKGVTFYESVLSQVREAICGKNGIYRKERQKIESNTEAFIATLVPVVLSTLRLPTAISGAAIVIVLLISKIGIQAFCESTATA